MRKEKKTTQRFTSIGLGNWRNFTEVSIDLQRRVFLVGPNASGKSNFLDAFRFLRDIVTVGGGFQEAVRRREGVSRLRCLAARQYSNIVIDVSIGGNHSTSGWKYELHFNQDRQRTPVIKKEKVLKGKSVILDRPDEKDNADPKRLTQTYLEQVYANQPFREIADFFTSIRYLHIVPHLVREPDRSIGRTDDPFGGDFLEQIARVNKRTRNAWLQRIGDALRVVVPQLKELRWERDAKGTPHLLGNYEHWRYKGAWQTEGDFSDGTLRLLGLLWATLDGTGPLLLEEPELSIHPEVVQFIPQMFARMQRRSGRQVLISTHSSDLLRDDGIGMDEVLLLEPTKEGTSVRAASSLEDITELLEGGIDLADAVMPRTRPPLAQQLAFFGDQ